MNFCSQSLFFGASGFPEFFIGGVVQVLFQMIGVNLISYLVVMSIIAITAQRSGSFMAGVGFAFFYGFVGMMASGHGLRDLYPVTAGLTLVGYQDGSNSQAGSVLLSVISILLMLTVTFIIVSTAKNQEAGSRKKNNLGKEIHRRHRKVR